MCCFILPHRIAFTWQASTQIPLKLRGYPSSSRVEWQVQVRNDPSMVRDSLSDTSAISVYRYGLIELSSNVTGEDNIPLVKYAL
jgi:hypothetical protein